jgi:ectoine hydroxylase
MLLKAPQLRQFAEEGYLFLPGCFSEEEVAILRDEAEQIYATDRREVWREKTGAPRTAFAAHTYNEAFRLLGSHPRLIRPVEQVFGEQLYMHQYKINAKAAFEGDVWQWHQDYGTWARDDGMLEPRAMNIAVFMDEVMPINGPLMLVPKSHRHGVLSAGHDEETTSYPLWTLDRETVTRLVQEGGIVAPTGKPGGVLMFHGNLVHGSAPNIALPAPHRLSDSVRRLQLHPQADPRGVDRASRLHADRSGPRRRAAELRPRRGEQGGGIGHKPPSPAARSSEASRDPSGCQLQGGNPRGFLPAASHAAGTICNFSPKIL